MGLELTCELLAWPAVAAPGDISPATAGQRRVAVLSSAELLIRLRLLILLLRDDAEPSCFPLLLVVAEYKPLIVSCWHSVTAPIAQ